MGQLTHGSCRGRSTRLALGHSRTAVSSRASVPVRGAGEMPDRAKTAWHHLRAAGLHELALQSRCAAAGPMEQHPNASVPRPPKCQCSAEPAGRAGWPRARWRLPEPMAAPPRHSRSARVPRTTPTHHSGTAAAARGHRSAQPRRRGLLAAAAVRVHRPLLHASSAPPTPARPGSKDTTVPGRAPKPAWRLWAAVRRPAGCGSQPDTASGCRDRPALCSSRNRRDVLSPAIAVIRGTARLILAPRLFWGGAVARCASAEPGRAGCSAPCGACGAAK